MLSERVAAALADDDVIEYNDIHEGQQVVEASRNEVICRARFEGTGGMVMCKNHRGGVMTERLPQHISRMYLRTVDRSAEKLLESDETSTTIEVKAAEDLMIEGPESQPQKVANLLGTR
jgi:hypothetical protein